MRRFIDTKFEDFVLNEKSNLETKFEFTDKSADDKEHNRLASKNKEGHKWEKDGDKKTGKASREQRFKCRCGYIKMITKDEDKKVTIKYNKPKK